jgi:DNA polymerase-3 subunit alpha (Gram-positive type)
LTALSNETNKERHPAVLHFYAFIEKCGLSAGFKESMMTADILKVEISSSEKKWRVHLLLREIVPKKLLEQLAAQITGQTPGLEKLEFVVKYSLPDLSIEELLNQYWDEVVYATVCNHPAIGGWIRSAVKKIDGCNLRIYPKSQIEEEYLRHCQIPEEITALIRREFDREIRVSLHCQEEEDCEVNEWLSQQDNEYAKALVTRQEEALPASKEMRNYKRKKPKSPEPGVITGRVITDNSVTIQQIVEEEKSSIIQGRIISLEARQLKSGRILLTFNLTDLTDSITVKLFEEQKEEGAVSGVLKKGMWVKVKGPVQQDDFSKELTMMARDINVAEFEVRMDKAPEKRVELHLHTKMSVMDGIAGVGEAISLASGWGHKAVAITDLVLCRHFLMLMKPAKNME